MKIRHCLSSVFVVCFIVTAFTFVSGCSSTKGASTSEQAVNNRPVAFYHDFEDVLIPKELTIIKNRTVVVSTPGFKSGILTLKGRVESNSLFNFFSVSMEKDNWQVISRIKAPEATIMVFQKATRCAVITIREEQIYTYVEIGIAPTLTGTGRGASQNPTNDLTY
ncbi:hypothetical protein [uncultured Desulfobacter sp.]|uniref:hypothetical protein n=1 Tax=uncultured Desulfobacter sp. TaxID=240139 RepID=UPI002AAB44E3|nr:hypothetical protein [uncultured Desulfobacter sp.]